MAKFVLSERYMSISLAQWHSEACKACRAGLKPLEKLHASLQKILQRLQHSEADNPLRELDMGRTVIASSIPDWSYDRGPSCLACNCTCMTQQPHEAGLCSAA